IITRGAVAARPLFAFALRLGRQSGFLAEQRFARQLHAILVVDGYHLDAEDVADLAYFIHAADKPVGQFADVAQAVAAGHDLDERAELLDRVHFALVDLA